MNTTPVYFAGIDIGSTASKTVILKDGKIEDYFVLPTGWNGRETANAILVQLKQRGYADSMRCVATGYGRICVDYADKIVTEITCHGKGGWAIFKKNMTIIDVGGQDTKMIKVIDGQVADFLMNDKCAAGVIHSVASRVANLAARFGVTDTIVLTGGLCESPYFIQTLSDKIGRPVETDPFARYAGALGAALTAAKRRDLA